MDVGVHEVPGLSAEGVLEVGHDGGVHAGEAVGAVDADDVLGALPLGGDAVGEQEVPVNTIWGFVLVVVFST